MKYINILIFLFLYTFGVSQETFYESIEHQAYEREYILYIPSSYDPDSPVSMPLVLSFHGYGSNAQTNFNYTKFSELAEEHNFILVHPQGAVYDNSTHWNVEGWISNSPYDDVGFIDALLDELMANYEIAEERVFAAGMSNGGYFSFLLGCQLSERIAAVASVTGSMTPQNFNACDPKHPMPVLQIHGTLDDVVPYGGNPLWTKSIADVMNYWNTDSACEKELIKQDIPNSSANDFSTVEKYVYEDCEKGIFNEHFKVIGGGHDWPGAWGNMDIDASKEIWRFFSFFTIEGELVISTSETKEGDYFTVYPNPTSDLLHVGLLDESPQKYEILNATGIVVKEGNVSASNSKIQIDNLEPNVYFLLIGGKSQRIVVVD